MKSTLAVLVLGMCLFTAACGDEAEFVAAPPSAAAPATPATPSATPAAASATPVKATSPSAAAKSPKPTTAKASPKPTTAAKADPEAACDATMKAENRLYTNREANGPLAVGDDATPAEVTAAVRALRAGTQSNIQAVRKARSLTTDKKVRAALADLIAARTAVVALLDAAGDDVDKKDAALFTADEAMATSTLWRYPDGLCAGYTA
ncbi:hypothetical protein [Actinoplanes sp. NPDC026670]|uniref:hypothetical protein n=1 Tax=Actinoplanes sp. NPDC026670 TaxID=3154700 RepID=UPI0033DFE7EE